MESLTLDFYNDFVKYLNEATHSRGRYRPNVIGKFVKNIRTFLRYAFDNNYTLNSEFKRREYKVFQETVETIYLNEDELQLLYDLELPPSQAEVRDAFLSTYENGHFVALDQAEGRDCFLVGCYT